MRPSDIPAEHQIKIQRRDALRCVFRIAMRLEYAQNAKPNLRPRRKKQVGPGGSGAKQSP
jgi:hypothetical protein